MLHLFFLSGEIKRLEIDLNKGRYVDHSFLNGLKNKMEVLRLGDEASKQVNSKHLMAERGSSFVNALRGATNKEEEEEQKYDIAQNGTTFSKRK